MPTTKPERSGQVSAESEDIMRNYTNFKVTEGSYASVVAEFDTFDAALAFIAEEYGADNAVDLLVQIDASNPEEEIEETFNFLEIYDMLMEQ